MAGKKVKTQIRLFQEMEKQLLVQADRLGVKEQFNPLKLKELELEALGKHLLAFYAERANLEYEMQVLGSDKKEVLIKLERLTVYIKRAENMRRQYAEKITKLLNKAAPDREKALKLTGQGGISFLVGVNR